MHQPVLLDEVLELIGIRGAGDYVDGTLGSGGHTAVLLHRMGSGGRVLGIDRDEAALERVRARMGVSAGRLILAQGDFGDMVSIAQDHGVDRVDGVLLDLGMSSDQVDTPDRGFSFLQEGPLDMRMDRRQSLTAAELVNTASADELMACFRTLGEEPMAGRIVRAIVADRQGRPFQTTGQLAGLVERVKGGRRGRIHPATKVFQALRMAVNHELDSLTRGLDGALRLVREGGRVAVISFHSLEDRIVKHFFSRHAGRWESLAAGGARWVGELPRMRLVTRKPVTASEEELVRNPRARSAKLRVAERMEES